MITKNSYLPTLRRKDAKKEAKKKARSCKEADEEDEEQARPENWQVYPTEQRHPPVSCHLKLIGGAAKGSEGESRRRPKPGDCFASLH